MAAGRARADDDDIVNFSAADDLRHYLLISLSQWGCQRNFASAASDLFGGGPQYVADDGDCCFAIFIAAARSLRECRAAS